MILKNYNPFNINVAIARSLMAVALALTLLFTDIYDLFIVDVFVSKGETELLKELSFFVLFGWQNLQIAKAVAILLLLMVVSGRFMKITSILHWWITLSYMHTSALVEGGEQIAAIMTLAFIPLCWFDNRKSHWDNTVPLTSISKSALFVGQIIIALIFIQISYLYFQAGSAKLAFNEWKDGTVMYYWLTSNIFGFTPMTEYYILDEFILKNEFLLLLMAWGSMFVEIVLSFSLFSTWEFRKFAFVLGVSFHFVVYIFIGLATFGLFMTASLVIYALPPIDKVPNLFKQSPTS